MKFEKFFHPNKLIFSLSFPLAFGNPSIYWLWLHMKAHSGRGHVKSEYIPSQRWSLTFFHGKRVTIEERTENVGSITKGNRDYRRQPQSKSKEGGWRRQSGNEVRVKYELTEKIPHGDIQQLEPRSEILEKSDLLMSSGTSSHKGLFYLPSFPLFFLVF